VYHSGTSTFPRVSRIQHDELDLATDACSSSGMPGKWHRLHPFITIEIFSMPKSMFRNTVFNTIDIYSVCKDGVVFFNRSPIPWPSDTQVPWDTYRKQLVEYISHTLSQFMASASRCDTKYAFYMKCNMINYHIKTKHPEIKTLRKEAQIAREIQAASTQEIRNGSMDRIVQALMSYSDPESRIVFILDILDSITLRTARKAIKFIGKAERYHAALLHYRMHQKALGAAQHRYAFLYLIAASRLLKQGANFDLEQSMMARAFECISEPNWISVMKGIASKVHMSDSLIYGENPYRLRFVDQPAFCIKTVELQKSRIYKCTGSNVVFNADCTDTCFTDAFELKIVFCKHTSVSMHGIVAREANASESIFIPVHTQLNGYCATVPVLYSCASHIDLQHQEIDELKIKLIGLVFSGSPCIPIDLDVVWIRRKSTLSIQDIEYCGTHNDENVYIKLLLSNPHNFQSNVIGIGTGDMARSGNTFMISFKASLSQDRVYTMHHEIASNVFESIHLQY